MLSEQSPATYLTTELTSAAIRGVTTPLATLAPPAWARRRLRTPSTLPRVTTLPRQRPNQGIGPISARRSPSADAAPTPTPTRIPNSTVPRRRQLQDLVPPPEGRYLAELPPPPEAVTAWREEWAAWRLKLRCELRTQLLPLLGQAADLAPSSEALLTRQAHALVRVRVRIRIRPNPNSNPNPSPTPNPTHPAGACPGGGAPISRGARLGARLPGAGPRAGAPST